MYCHNKTFRYSQILFVSLLMLIFMFGLQACRKKALYSTSDLKGEWIRFDGNKPLYDSMIVEFSEANGGIILYSSPNGYFANGDNKWKEVTYFKDSTFKYKDLGSDGTYYDGNMKLSTSSSGDFILHLTPSVSGSLNGNDQYWKKN